MSATASVSVERRAESPGGAVQCRGRFEEALDRARASASETSRRNQAPGQVATATQTRKAGRASGPGPDTCPADGSLAPFASFGPSPPSASLAGGGEVSAVAELRACVRAAPPLIAAALRPGGAQLALTFGPSLAVDLRTGVQGLELTLRPAAGLERAARAEVPGLVEALRAQGLRVARAEVRPRGGGTPRRAR